MPAEGLPGTRRAFIASPPTATLSLGIGHSSGIIALRTLIIGANGQLGLALRESFAKDHEVVETVHRSPGIGQTVLDLGDESSVRGRLQETKPDVILMAGAFCHVDLCETESQACRRVNVDGTKAVARYACEQGCRVVYYSTDQVFDGASDAHRELDVIAPLNMYAKSKAEGEATLREMLPDRHLILRTAWLYGPDTARKNFALRLVARVSAGEEVLVPADQWGTPTYTADLALATRELVERRASGTFHAVGPERIDRLSLARKVCARFGLNTDLLIPKTTREMGQAAPRPLKVFLDCRRIREAGVGVFRGVDDGLAALYQWHSAGAAAAVR